MPPKARFGSGRCRTPCRPLLRVEAGLLDAHADAAQIHAKVGIFFGGILAGCSCADDPTPVEPQTEYCELLLTLDRTSGKAAVELIEAE